MVVLVLLVLAVAAFGAAACAAVARRAAVTGVAASAFLLSGGLGLHLATSDPPPERVVLDADAARPPLWGQVPEVQLPVTAPPWPSPPAPPSPSPLPQGVLEVFSDGCGVIRSDFGGQPPSGLQWQVVDADGFEVLARGAEGETRYRYFRPGTYRVVLQAYDGDAYVPVSNEVTIRC